MPKAKQQETSAGLVYLGGGFISGVPARDLTPEEVELYGRAIISALPVVDEQGEPLPVPTPAEALTISGFYKVSEVSNADVQQ